MGALGFVYSDWSLDTQKVGVAREPHIRRCLFKKIWSGQPRAQAFLQSETALGFWQGGCWQVLGASLGCRWGALFTTGGDDLGAPPENHQRRQLSVTHFDNFVRLHQS